MGALYLLLYIVIAVLTAIAYFVHKRHNYWKDRGIPHDPPHFLMGNMKGFRKEFMLQEIYQKTYKKYKESSPFCGFYLFTRPVAFILDVQLAKDILIKHFSNFPNRGNFYNERDDPLTGHLFALDGEKWKRLRQKLSPTFTSGKMKFMFPTIVEVGDRFVHVLADMVNKCNIIEMKELCARFTTDVIGTCAFGIECNSLKDPNAEFRLMGRAAFTKARHGRLVLGFITSFPKLARKLRMRRIDEGVHQFFMRVVRDTVAFREQHNIKRNDFMDLLLELKNAKSQKTEDGEELKGLSVEQVAAMAFGFFLAGFETSSTTMSFALYELACHEDIQDKVRQEISDTMAKHEHKLTYECIKDMRYLNQVISETLRLYTVLPHLQREALSDFPLPNNTSLVIEKGTRVLIPSSAIHHDPQIYPDPLAFKPERFTLEAVADRDSCEWLPFGEGPRNCIGKRFGQMQVRVGLALLLKNFKFSICKQTQRPIKFNPKSFVLATKDGIDLQVVKLN